MNVDALLARVEGLDWLGIPVARWVIFLVVLTALFLVLKLVATIARRRLRRRAGTTEHRYDDYFLHILDRTWTFSVLAIAAFLALYFVDMRAEGGVETVEHTIRTLALIVIFLQAGSWASGATDAALQHGFRFANFTEAAAQTAFGVVKFFALLAIWTSVAILVLSAFGVEITPLLAGLGVGGIAVAFALQQILGDIFCSVAIVLDRPFEVGDFIINGDFMGSVEHIGVKTTRVRSLGGEQIIFPNSDLIGSRIRNYKRMVERRVVFSFGVLYSTPADVLEQVPEIIRRIINDAGETRFDRAHFAAFGDSSLNFEVVYYVLSPDYNLYMDIQQRINLALVRELSGLNTDFAFPTRTLYLAADNGPLKTEVQLLNGGRESSPVNG